MEHFFASLYEKFKLYKLNPCDFDSWFKWLAPGFEFLTTKCPCCTGARIVFVALLAAVFPVATISVICLAFLWGLTKWNDS